MVGATGAWLGGLGPPSQGWGSGAGFGVRIQLESQASDPLSQSRFVTGAGVWKEVWKS